MLKTFSKGGIHPEENKLSRGSLIKVLPLPQKAIIPLSQHIGAPAVPIVQRGDKVKVGQVIATSQGFVSTNIHSSVSGVIEKIDATIDSSGYKRNAVIIEVDGDFWEDEINRSEYLNKEIRATREEIIKKTLEAGIVGLGGAGFPSHVKLSLPKGKKVDIIIINGAECEPYLTADHRLLLEKGEEILVGTQLFMKALNVNKAIIGIEYNKPDAFRHIRNLSGDFNGIEIQPLMVKYPQGGEKQLIKAMVNREVPSGGLPLDVRAIVHNVATTYALYEAVQKNKPLVERVVTITGKSLQKPSNYMVRIGTPIRDLIEAAGTLPEDTGKIVLGGPMMGKAVNSLDIPVVKTTSGILIFPEKESKREKIERCIRCANCISACPMGLQPYLLMTLSLKEMFEKAENEQIMDCNDCGACSYICPSSRPLLDYIRLGKSTVTQLRRSRRA